MQTKQKLRLQATCASRAVVTPAIHRIGTLLNSASVAIAFKFRASSMFLLRTVGNKTALLCKVRENPSTPSKAPRISRWVSLSVSLLFLENLCDPAQD
jgi:hypothetical protein